MEPRIINISDMGEGVVRVTASISVQDMSNVLRMVNRMLAYTYEIDSKSDEDIPVLLAEKLGVDALEEARDQMTPALLAPFVINGLDFETILNPSIAEASSVTVGAPFEFSIDVHRKPAYELSSYEPVTITLPKARFDEEELTGLIVAIADEYADYEPVFDGEPVRQGDRATIDMETYGEFGPVLPLCGKGMRVTVGQGWLAEEIDENLEGMCIGEKKRFSIQALTEASKDEHDTEKLNVTIELKGIERPKAFDITDEWVAAHIEGVSTVAQFKELVQERMIQGTAQPQSEEVLLAKAAEALVERLDMHISDELYQHVVNEMLSQMDQQAFAEGTPFDEYLAARGLSMDTLGDYLMARAKSQIEQGFALDAYYRHFDLDINGGDIDRAAAHMVGSDRLDAVDSLRKQFELAGKLYVLREKARRLKANRVALERATIEYT